MNFNLELTDRLKDVVMNSRDEIVLEDYELADVPVADLEQFLEFKRNAYWTLNGHMYTNVPFETLIRSMSFENEVDATNFEINQDNPYINRYITLSPYDVGFCKTRGITLTEKDREMLGLTAFIPIQECSNKKNSPFCSDLERAYHIDRLVTVLSQPSGRTQIPGNFFNVLVDAVKKNKGDLFVVNATFDNSSSDGEEFCIAYLNP